MTAADRACDYHRYAEALAVLRALGTDVSDADLARYRLECRRYRAVLREYLENQGRRDWWKRGGLRRIWRRRHAAARMDAATRRLSAAHAPLLGGDVW